MAIRKIAESRSVESKIAGSTAAENKITEIATALTEKIVDAIAEEMMMTEEIVTEEITKAERVTAIRTDGTSHATDPPEDLGTLTTMMDGLMFLIDVSTAINTMFQNE